jgi:hypothetical protein
MATRQEGSKKVKKTTTTTTTVQRVGNDDDDVDNLEIFEEPEVEITTTRVTSRNGTSSTTAMDVKAGNRAKIQVCASLDNRGGIMNIRM